MAVDGQGPRFEVSLPIRYSRDGRAWGDEVVTSLSTTNLFVQTTALPDVQSRMFFSIGMGADTTYHGEGRVTAHLNRDVGGMTASGFGLKFDEPPMDLPGVIAKLERVYLGAVAIDVDGRLIWPVPTDPDIPNAGSDSDGLTLWSNGQEVARATFPEGAAPASPSQTLPEYLRMLREMTGTIAATDAERLVLTYRGRTLSPTTGIPTRVLLESLTALAQVGAGAAPPGGEASTPADAAGMWTLDLSDVDEPTGDIAPPPPPPPPEIPEGPTEVEVLWEHPFLELIAVQMRLVDALQLGGWRFQRIEPELRASLERDRAVLEEVGLRMSAVAEEAALDEGLSREIGHAVEDLGSFLQRTVWHAAAIETPEASQNSYETWQIEKERLARQATLAREPEAPKSGGRKAEPPKSGVRKADTAKRDREEAKKPPKAEKKPSKRGNITLPEQVQVTKKTLYGGGLAVVAVIAGLYFAFRTRGPEIPDAIDVAQTRAEIQKVAPAFVLQDAKVEKGVAKLVVSMDWLAREPGDRINDFSSLSLVLFGMNFTDVVVVTPDNKRQAVLHEGKIWVQGAETNEK